MGPLRINWVFPASDGWVTITLLFGPIAAYTVRLIEWMVEDGAIEPEAAKADWVHFLSDVLSGKVAAEELDHLQERIAAFTGSHTKAELLAGALERRVLMAPVATVPELLSSDQLDARGYWEEVDGIRYPGPFAIAGGGGPRMAPLGPSPELGQHTAEVLDAVPVGAAQPVPRPTCRSESTSNRREASSPSTRRPPRCRHRSPASRSPT